MSLNWKEINLILSELDLPGSQVQKIIQSTYDVLALQIHGKGKTKTLLIALTPGACRIHETFRAVPKNEKPLRFAEFLKSRILNCRIAEAVQLGEDRIVRLLLLQGKNSYFMYLRLWSNAANVIVTDEAGTVLDAMRRSPKRGEVTGGHYEPADQTGPTRDNGSREFTLRDLPGEGSFNEKIDAWYAEHGGALSLEALREQARRLYDRRINKIQGALESLQSKEEEYQGAGKFKEYGDIIMANLGTIESGAAWLDTVSFYTGEQVRIKLDPKKKPSVSAEQYYQQYRKAKNGIEDIRAEIQSTREEINRLEASMAATLAETNPLRLHKLIKSAGTQVRAAPKPGDTKRPGLSFRRRDWLIIVGRDASENDALLRRYVKGNDLWLHARNYPGSYVFIKQRPGKSVPLDILLDAATLAIFYSKGRNAGEGDLFYTPVKYLRRAKNGPKGLVIPTQEKNLHIKLEESRLRELEQCRVEK
ncbi:NFACT RNA binding domain-containing protein [Breznakiella homolactica]|uniref:NFACT family protein n=1 Tax=Breznakiella homolactica TaxID=2798577 RepID=A0A7T8BD62_9SPIR|nr:NFACT family protein [Breznakiella homolactica]QQO10923.1 NFACT family protein [Breznakiella homolactica]